MVTRTSVAQRVGAIFTDRSAIDPYLKCPFRFNTETSGNIDSHPDFFLFNKMPLLRAIVAAILLPACLSVGSIEYLEQKFYPEESFARISEYFDGIEVPGNRIILRSDSNARTGHYITFQMSSTFTIDHFKLEVFEFGVKDPTEYIFKPDSSIPSSKPIYLGLTGEKWADKYQPPVAYKLSVIGPDRKALLTATSFLWGDD